MDKEIVVYQNEEGAIDLKIDASTETIWASQKQLSELYGVDVRTVNEHLSNIFRIAELDEEAVIRKFRITASDGKSYNTKHYNLDAIISVGYRINSKNATKFRKWATTTLKSYITDGFAINPDRIERNKNLFLQSLEDLKLLAASSEQVGSSQAVDLVAQFAKTWFSLDAYDRADLPEAGGLKRSIEISAKDLEVALHTLRSKLISKGEATELFAQEKYVGSLEGLFGNVFQSYDGEDVYQTLEEKAAHLLYS